MREAAIAVNVLSHEAWHLAGVREEAVAQCYALQSNADTALRLGAGPGATHTRSPSSSSARCSPALPSDYRTRDCFDDGPLDLHRDRPTWP